MQQPLRDAVSSSKGLAERMRDAKPSIAIREARHRRTYQRALTRCLIIGLFGAKRQRLHEEPQRTQRPSSHGAAPYDQRIDLHD